MKNIIKIAFYVFAMTVLLWLNMADAAINAWTVTNAGLQWSSTTADITIQSYINSFLTFLYLIAVVMGLWGGFNILTAAWDEEKVKKWKTVLIQAGIWLVVIFLADSLVNWLITSILIPGA